MSKEKRKYYKPSVPTNIFVIRRQDMEGKHLPSIEIKPAGFSTVDPEIQKILDNNPLKGHKLGFIEIQSEDRLPLAKKDEKKDESSEEESEPEESDESSDTASITTINEAKDYLKAKGMDGRQLTTKDKILKAAKNFDPPVTFPNLT